MWSHPFLLGKEGRKVRGQRAEEVSPGGLAGHGGWGVGDSRDKRRGNGERKLWGQGWQDRVG